MRRKAPHSTWRPGSGGDWGNTPQGSSRAKMFLALCYRVVDFFWGDLCRQAWLLNDTPWFSFRTVRWAEFPFLYSPPGHRLAHSCCDSLAGTNVVPRNLCYRRHGFKGSLLSVIGFDRGTGNCIMTARLKAVMPIKRTCWRTTYA